MTIDVNVLLHFNMQFITISDFKICYCEYLFTSKNMVIMMISIMVQERRNERARTDGSLFLHNHYYYHYHCYIIIIIIISII